MILTGQGDFEPSACFHQDIDIFDADKASSVVTALSKKRKIKSKKVSSLEEFEGALDKVRIGSQLAHRWCWGGGAFSVNAPPQGVFLGPCKG